MNRKNNGIVLVPFFQGIKKGRNRGFLPFLFVFMTLFEAALAVQKVLAVAALVALVAREVLAVAALAVLFVRLARALPGKMPLASL